MKISQRLDLDCKIFAMQRNRSANCTIPTGQLFVMVFLSRSLLSLFLLAKLTMCPLLSMFLQVFAPFSFSIFFLKKWANPGLFLFYFRSFLIIISIQIEKKHRWFAWDSNPGPQDGRHRQNLGAMAATVGLFLHCSKYD